MKVEKYLWCRPYVSKVKEWAGCNMTKRTGGPSICNISKVSGTRSGFGKRVNWVFWQFLCPSVIGLAFVCF